jgi:hypothetical protein
MNRLNDFVEMMPYKIEAANACPPVEILTVDYNSTDGLDKYMHNLRVSTRLEGGSFFSYHLYTGRDTYHAAHANNLAMLTGEGEYVVLVPADVYISSHYLSVLRNLIKDDAVWCNTDKKHRSTIAIKKDEFIAAGGYDERMEMYGPDDLDLIERLERRGCKRGRIPDDLITDIYTSPEKKVANYRIKNMSHKELGALSMPYYLENKALGSLVANVGMEWGSWK